MDLKTLETRLQNRTPGLQDVLRKSAVLVPLVERPEGLCLLFEVRAAGMIRQPGEVCFPGGRIEEGETPAQTAVRETWEELGIPPESIHVMGDLDFLDNPGDLVLFPVLAKVDAEAVEHMVYSPEEVAETFFVPLTFLKENKPRRWHLKMTPEAPANFPYEKIGYKDGYTWRTITHSVLLYTYEGHPIWGMTAKCVRWFINYLVSEGLL